MISENESPESHPEANSERSIDQDGSGGVTIDAAALDDDGRWLRIAFTELRAKIDEIFARAVMQPMRIDPPPVEIPANLRDELLRDAQHVISCCRERMDDDPSIQYLGLLCDEWVKRYKLRHERPSTHPLKCAHALHTLYCSECGVDVRNAVIANTPRADWIHVRDQLPADGQDVFYAFNGQTWPGKYLGCDNEHGLPCFASRYGGWLIGDVEWWMPAPEAPESTRLV